MPPPFRAHFLHRVYLTMYAYPNHRPPFWSPERVGLYTFHSLPQSLPVACSLVGVCLSGTYMYEICYIPQPADCTSWNMEYGIEWHVEWNIESLISTDYLRPGVQLKIVVTIASLSTPPLNPILVLISECPNLISFSCGAYIRVAPSNLCRWQYLSPWH